MAAVSVTVTCAECKNDFSYVQKSNVPRKFCDECAAIRVQRSKEQSLAKKRSERREEEEARRKLEAIPDMPIHPGKLIDKYISGKLR